MRVELRADDKVDVLPTLPVGTRVQALFGAPSACDQMAPDAYRPGKIARVSPKGSKGVYDVDFDDGSKAYGLLPRHVRVVVDYSAELPQSLRTCSALMHTAEDELSTRHEVTFTLRSVT